jgi:hypothetical protein
VDGHVLGFSGPNLFEIMHNVVETRRIYRHIYKTIAELAIARIAYHILRTCSAKLLESSLCIYDAINRVHSTCLRQQRPPIVHKLSGDVGFCLEPSLG